MYKSIALLMVIGLTLSSAAFPTDDKVDSLYLMGDLSFGLYSGYVTINDTQKQLHYVAALSQNNWTTDPVIVWFNGGPGCSSMLGFLQEHGPYVMDDGTTTFAKNDYAWNKEATLIYIESPAGVGFSICGNTSECNFTDTLAASDNLVALYNIMVQKFPDLQKNDLYLSGESYAGIYVPMLAKLIDEWNTNNTGKEGVYLPNLKGFMVGNGVTSTYYDGFPASFEMSFFFGLIDTKLYKNVKENCDIHSDTPFSEQCQTWIDTYSTEISGINPYDYLGKCYTANTTKQSELNLYRTQSASPNVQSDEVTQVKKYTTAQKYTPFHFKKLKEVPPCVYGQPIIDYLSNDTVRTALHIPTTVQKWDLCADDFNYTGDVNGTIDKYEDLRGKYKILKYSGDTDGVIPTQGTKNWIDAVGWNITSEWRAYHVDGQVGGYVEQREGNFTFASIHGAGHMAPQWKRPQTYHVIFSFIKDQKI